MLSFSIIDGQLTTERLVLRPYADADVAAVADGTRRPDYADDYPAEGDHAIVGFIRKNPNARHQFGQRQIVERESGLVVGGVGLFWPPTDGAIEFGYGVSPSRQGRGYATEAAAAIVAYALTAPGVTTVFADVELPNPASVRVLRRIGLHHWSSDEETTRYGTSPTP